MVGVEYGAPDLAKRTAVLRDRAANYAITDRRHDVHSALTAQESSEIQKPEELAMLVDLKVECRPLQDLSVGSFNFCILRKAQKLENPSSQEAEEIKFSLWAQTNSKSLMIYSDGGNWVLVSHFLAQKRIVGPDESLFERINELVEND